MKPSNGFDLITETVTIAGVDLAIEHPRCAEDLIDEDEYAHDERLPYWADIWPSGQVLAAWCAKQDLRGLRVVELGAGLGIPSLMALRGGAEVLATDWYPEALAFARANAARAGAGTLATMIVDWGAPPPELFAHGTFDVILGADILYENRHAGQLAPLIARLSGSATRIVIADPRRPSADGLLAELRETGWVHQCDEVTHTARPDEQGSRVHLHRFHRRVGAPRLDTKPVLSDRL